MRALLFLLVTTIPIQIYEYLPIIEVKANGKPMSLLIDTAAPHSAAKTKIATLEFPGGEQFRATGMKTIDLSSFERTEGRHLDGILGADFFQRYVVEIDFDAEVIRLHDPATFRLPEDFEPIPIHFKSDKPFIAATLKLPGRAEEIREYLVDTGSAGAISDDLFKDLTALPIGPDLGRAEWLAIGTFRFDGANGTVGNNGIGGELLHRFNLIVDFPHSRFLLQPNRHFRDALLFDTSGIEFERADAGFRIVQVYPRTPGAERGLRAGDVITHIDGQPASSLGLLRTRLLFHQVRTHELRILRGKQVLMVVFPLRRLL